MRLIGIVGLPGSGKGEFSRCAADLGIPVLVMGDVIRRVAAERGLSPDDDVLGRISGELREIHGRGAIARLMLPAIRELAAPVVLIDGIRSDAEVDEFRRGLPRVRADRGLLVVRDAARGASARRGRSDDVADPDALERRDERELGWGLGAALAGAEHTVVNEGSLEAYCADVRALLLSLREGA